MTILTLTLVLFLCTPPNPQAPIPVGGQLFVTAGDGIDTPFEVGWVCQDYTVHWTVGPIETHYVCTSKDTCDPRHRTVAASHVRMTKD